MTVASGSVGGDTLHVSTPASEPIAIIGIGCRLPRSPRSDWLWILLCAGVDAISEVPPDRFDIDALFDPQPGPSRAHLNPLRRVCGRRRPLRSRLLWAVTTPGADDGPRGDSCARLPGRPFGARVSFRPNGWETARVSLFEPGVGRTSA